MPLWKTRGRTVIVVLIIRSEILVVTIETLIARSGLRGRGVSLESEGAGRGSFRIWDLGFSE